mmetsp:Transcript_33915/g.55017  ORF Transcript_33915/g.55017 Transcript_33915/m.55017 type:complete len:933 (+) Transcript_33915:210-3008(+)
MDKLLAKLRDAFESKGIHLSHAGGGKKKKAPRRRMTEKEGDKEMLAAAQNEEDVVRLTQQPANIKFGTMRGYQLEGLNFIINLWSKGMGAILADEMGLGKTLQSISVMAYLLQFHKIEGPHLVTVPLSTLGNWIREINRWCPDLKPLMLHGTKEERPALIQRMLSEDRDWGVVVTTYEMLNREKGKFSKVDWHYIIVDEAHRLKNENSLFSVNLRTMRSRCRLLLTGTPLQNNLHELWALLNYLMPGIFSNSEEFDSIFETDTDSKNEVMEQLHLVLKPFMIRRLKVDAESSLLPKKEMLVFVGMSALQKQVYKGVLDKNLLELLGEQKKQGKTKLLNIVMQLRKAANHPYLFEGVEDRDLPPFGEHLIENSGKLVVLDKLLAKLKRDGSRVLIFCQMTRMIDILEDYCRSRRFRYCRIDGNTDQITREKSMADFNEPDSKYFVFLLSTRAGGLGINLYTADIVVLYDSDWNPQVDLQAQDRAHRIGQKKQVKVFRFVTERTIEEKVVEAANRKLQMDALVVQSGRLAKKNKLSKDDMIEAIKFGADSIFKSTEGTITDEDIDLILARGEAKTEEMKSKIQKNEGLLKLSLDGKYHNFEEPKNMLDKTEISQENMQKLIKMQSLSLGTRSRKQVQRAGVTADIKYRVSLPEPPMMPKHLHDYQFFNLKRIRELVEKAWSFYTKHKSDLDPPKYSDQYKNLSDEDEEELSRLMKSGMSKWKKKHYSNFVKLLGRKGRNKEWVCRNMPGKSYEETAEYYDVFFANFEALTQKVSIQKAIDKAEKQIEQYREYSDVLSCNVLKAGEESAVDVLGVTLKAQQKEKGFDPSEDRFLLCKTHEYGFGNWDDVKDAVRTTEQFEFDYFLKTRTAAELGRRVTALVKLLKPKKELAQQLKRKSSSSNVSKLVEAEAASEGANNGNAAANNNAKRPKTTTT